MVSGDDFVTKLLIAARGTGVAWLVDEVEELEEDPELAPVLAVLARAVVGVADASVCTGDVRAEVPVEEESELLLPLVFDRPLVGVEASAPPDVGVSVACEPLLMADVRPETLCA
jgi:hypothetical protein